MICRNCLFNWTIRLLPRSQASLVISVHNWIPRKSFRVDIDLKHFDFYYGPFRKGRINTTFLSVFITGWLGIFQNCADRVELKGKDRSWSGEMK